MKDKFFWVLLILLIFQGVIVNLLDNRITELEEKAKHFRCLEKRVSKYHQAFPRSGGGWFIAVDSVDVTCDK